MTTEATRKVMRGNRSRDTGPELTLRRALHRLGLRYRLHQRIGVEGLRVRPDVVFPKRRVAVFVDGCFWHACPRHYRLPKSNVEFWQAKVQRNLERDQRVDYALGEAGWCVIRVWEHDLARRAHVDVAALRVQAAVLWPEVGVRSTECGTPVPEWDAVACCVPHPGSDEAEDASEDGGTQYVRPLIEEHDDAGVAWGRMCAVYRWHCAGCRVAWGDAGGACWCCGEPGREGLTHAPTRTADWPVFQGRILTWQGT